VTRRQIALVVVIVLVASALSALVAYRRALRHTTAFSGSSSVLSGEAGQGCVNFRDAGSYVGKPGCVSGRVLRVFTSRAGNTFLDFCADYRQCPFGSVVFASDRSKFGDLGALRGRQVELRGLITTYQGRAEIIINDPQQIHVVP
jgi:hypothetical protein